MKKVLLSLSLFFFVLSSAMAQQFEEAEIKAVIDRLFEGMHTRNAAQVAAVFHSSARLQSIGIQANGTALLKEDRIEDFVNQIASLPPDLQIEERILSYEVRQDAHFATVWTPYEFYIDGVFSHCGTNAFHLFKDAESGWLIIQITDTRKKNDCL